MNAREVMDAIVECQRLLGELNRDLAMAPGWKRLTQWYYDRCGARQRLLRRIEHLNGVRRRLEAESN